MAQDTGSHAATADNARGTKTVLVVDTRDGVVVKTTTVTGKK